MIVKTPAMKLDVELRKADEQAGQVTFSGAAGTMPCTVTLSGSEIRALLRMSMRWPVVKCLFQRSNRGRT